MYATDASSGWDSSEGSIATTGRPLDVAIQGQGFIAVQDRDGQEAYTRNGDLHLTADGVLETSSGQPVLGDNGPITVPPSTSIQIADDGTVSVVPQGSTPGTIANVGRIKLVNPPADSLVRESGGLFQLAAGGTAPADASVKIASGAIESSNVDLASAMVNMIDLARSFDLQVKAMQTADTNAQSSVATPPVHLNRRPDPWKQHSGPRKPASTRSRRRCPSLRTTSPTSIRPATRKTARYSRTCCTRSQTQVGADTSQTTQSPSGMSIGTGVRSGRHREGVRPGNSSTQTGNPLDVAISGQGFFQVQMPDGTLAYTRDGSSRPTPRASSSPRPAMSVQPGITIPQGAQSVTIGTDGTVTVLLPGQSSPTQVGQLQLANFINPPGLQPVGQNLLVQSASSGSPQTGTPGRDRARNASLRVDLESSNVDVVEELVNMIQTQRAYEMNSKAISTVDQMLQYATENM